MGTGVRLRDRHYTRRQRDGRSPMVTETVNLERALLAAIDDDDLPAADRLIRSGVDVNRRGPLPLTALMLAAGRGSTQMVGKLLAAGADVHAVDSTMGA